MHLLIRLHGALIVPQHICPRGRLDCTGELRVGQRRSCGCQRVCPALEALALRENFAAFVSPPVAGSTFPTVKPDNVESVYIAVSGSAQESGEPHSSTKQCDQWGHTKPRQASRCCSYGSACSCSASRAR